MEPTAPIDAPTEVITETSQAPQPQVQPPAQPDAAAPTVNVEDLIARNQRLEAKNEKVITEKKIAQRKLQENETKVQQLLDGLGQLIGLEEEADPKVLAQRVGILSDQNRALQVEKRAVSAAYRAGIDPDIAVPILRDQGKLNIDLTSEDANTVLEAAVNGLAEQYPNLVSGTRAAPKPQAQTVAPQPSGATPATDLATRAQQVIRDGNHEEITKFFEQYGTQLYPNTRGPGGVVVG